MYIFIFVYCRTYYKLTDKINPKFVLRRGKEQWPGYYYIHPTVKSILDSNAVFKEMVKMEILHTKIFFFL